MLYSRSSNDINSDGILQGREEQLMNRDCILFNEKQADCRGLDKLYCAIEDKPCLFYKPEALYNRDGSKKKYKGKVK